MRWSCRTAAPSTPNQAGAYQALHEAGLEPGLGRRHLDRQSTAPLIASNLPERRLDRLREFWETITRDRPGFARLGRRSASGP
ncbi:hypothetical protein MexAM1_META1p1837 [Methylorubrum extorquens AM1]|uniref:Uncharacterized protein n=1 Tax=Methylorubrum extorquens (strain ATCC 14718 / DSM 1338 / JCM 2805 / NCIMB 9133 / AM1) TaxID=272630 RepID=C5B1P5_METEA|nr:hypothetical protein MexAM1_META1p1837 [Methylorubrum extorquens AM1]